MAADEVYFPHNAGHGGALYPRLDEVMALQPPAQSPRTAPDTRTDPDTRPAYCYPSKALATLPAPASSSSASSLPRAAVSSQRIVPLVTSRSYTLRDPLFALIYALALAYLGFLTWASTSSGQSDFVFALKRALTSSSARAAVFEFPFVRSLVAQLALSTLVARACALAAPLSLVVLLAVRVAGRFVCVVACAAALVAALVAALRASAFAFTHEHVALALLCVCAAFVALVLLYVLRVQAHAVLAFGSLLEEAAAVVLCALPGLAAASLVVGALVALFAYWLAVTLASLLTQDVHRAGTGTGTGAVVFVGGSEASVYFCVLVGAWTLQLAKSVLRLSVAGGAHAWRRGDSASAGVLATLARALTLSLGSLAVASLLVTVVETANMLLERSRSLLKRAGLAYAASLLKCVLVALRCVLRYVNAFAYVEMARDGCSFFDASRRVFARVRTAPGSLLVSYSLARYVLTALRALVALGAVALAAAWGASSLGTGIASRSSALAFSCAYLVAGAPLAWLEGALHCALVHDLDGALAHAARSSAELDFEP